MPIPKRQLSPLIRKYVNGSRPAQAETRGLGELIPVEPAARREGVPVLGDDQVYVVKYGTVITRRGVRWWPTAGTTPPEDCW